MGWLKSWHSFSFGDYYDPERMGFGALRVINDDIIAAGRGFGMHPHQNMEIVTVPLSGSLQHEDSMGHKTVIRPGEIQAMSAGTGVRHSEWNHSQTEAVSLFQIWIQTREPNRLPGYSQKFMGEKEKNTWQLLVAPDSFAGDVVTIHQDAWITRGRFEAGQNASYFLNQVGNGVFILVVNGQLEFEGLTLSSRDAVAITSHPEIEFQFNQETDLLVLEVPL